MSSENAADIETIATKSAAEIGRAIGAGAVDPRALTEHYLTIAEKTPNVYVRLTADRAKREAAAAYERARLGLRRGPLDGVPISWKDLVDFGGLPTEGGSRLCEGAVAAHDAPILAEASHAGLVAVGKTHLSELAFSGLGYNPMTATSPNVFDASRVPGGSSSGAAASVAFGAAAAAIGSDTGGSVRIPAAWNGLVGLKTTYGLISLDGVSKLSPSLDTIGPLTRTVEDAGLVTAALIGGRAPDLTGATLAGKTFLVAETVVLDEMDAAVADGFERALERLAAAGAVIKRGPVPEFQGVAHRVASGAAVVNTEGYAVWGEAIEARPDDIFVQIRERFRSGKNVTGDQAEKTKFVLQSLKKSYLARTAAYDAVLMPTSPILAPKIERIANDTEAYVRDNLLALRNTRLGNMLGLCSLTLPAGSTADGLPTPIMAFSPPFSEAILLRLGAAMERPLADC